jgi:hypothetical protein
VERRVGPRRVTDLLVRPKRRGWACISRSDDYIQGRADARRFLDFLSLGLHLLPHETWQQTPRLVETVFSNPVISVIIFVLIFEKIVFPGPAATGR